MGWLPTRTKWPALRCRKGRGKRCQRGFSAGPRASQHAVLAPIRNAMQGVPDQQLLLHAVPAPRQTPACPCSQRVGGPREPQSVLSRRPRRPEQSASAPTAAALATAAPWRAPPGRCVLRVPRTPPGQPQPAAPQQQR
jgi:hypothetical protein